MNPPILAFYSNGRQAGKDTGAGFASEWATEHGRQAKRLGFADAGKELAALALGMGDTENMIKTMDMFKLDGGISIEVSEGLGHHITGRDFLINLMEGVRSMFGQDAWIDHVLPTLEPGMGYLPDITLISDLRFMPEVMAVGRRGGKIVEIVNPRAEEPDGRSEGEISEGYIDYQIVNDGTLEEYRVKVFALLDGIYA